MFERYTDAGRAAVEAAEQQAKDLHHNYLGTEHLLLGVLTVGDGRGARGLINQGLTVDRARELIDQLVGSDTLDVVRGAPPRTPRLKQTLAAAAREAERLSDGKVAPDHLVLALTADNAGVAARIFDEASIDTDAIRTDILSGDTAPSATSSAGASPRKKKTTFPELAKYGRNLTQAARDGQIDPVIGRDTELERVVQILLRRTKNNPILVGEPGVGKTAVAEGLARLVVAGRVPAELRDTEIYTLELASMLAGTKWRGDFEKRLNGVIKEACEGDVIVFIDEIHDIVSAGSSAGALDAANIVKPALARGEMRVIGATTLDEFRKKFERDAALERRFQQVEVGEPTQLVCLDILRGLRGLYEDHHEVHLPDETLKAAADLSATYIADRHLPDKAIDLIDEAASRVAMAHAKDRAAAEKVTTADEGAGPAGKTPPADTTTQAERPVVSSRDIAEVLQQWTGIPAAQIALEQGEKLRNAEEGLHGRVIGQDEPVQRVARALRRRAAGLSDPERPLGSFLFLGPTGVGKTELARTLAEYLFGDEEAMVRLDMSEYMEKHAMSRLIGSPPGYVGHNEGGQLTEALRRKPYTVLLLDEIEKAHPDVLNILLQGLDDGRVTDGQGRTVSLRHAIVIMTSNLGAREIAVAKKFGFALAADTDEQIPYADLAKRVQDELKRFFRPELLNRIDEVLVFRALTREQVGQIIDLLLARVRDQLTDRGVELELTDAGREKLAELGFDPAMGARPLRRVIQAKIEDPLTDLLLSGALNAGDEDDPRAVIVDSDGDDITVTVATPVAA